MSLFGKFDSVHHVYTGLFVRGYRALYKGKMEHFKLEKISLEIHIVYFPYMFHGQMHKLLLAPTKQPPIEKASLKGIDRLVGKRSSHRDLGNLHLSLALQITQYKLYCDTLCTSL